MIAAIALFACLATAEQWDDLLSTRYGEELVMIGRDNLQQDWRFYVNWRTRSYTWVLSSGRAGWCILNHGRFITATSPSV